MILLVIFKDLKEIQEGKKKRSNWLCLASESNRAVRKSIWIHQSRGRDPCHINGNIYMTAFGIAEIILSQIPDFNQLWWLSILAAVMSFTYSTIGLGLGMVKVIGMILFTYLRIKILSRNLTPIGSCSS